MLTKKKGRQQQQERLQHQNTRKVRMKSRNASNSRSGSRRGTPATADLRGTLAAGRHEGTQATADLRGTLAAGRHEGTQATADYQKQHASMHLLNGNFIAWKDIALPFR